ncbi:Uncharacterized protein SCF082_LOCUS35839 [Durusdinium trenchii]|uniref:DDE-1 domain-containing protein n=1 Tax=Durusdinium trenchii TaxID=1381693 RepID=A0ABP0PBQ4_9DINO
MIGDSSPVRGDVVSYLESIYESMAETLPDFRDVKLDPNQRDLVVDVGSEEREADPYALGSSEVTLIQDGMDQNKFLIPRHEVLYGKEFGSFMRPKCHISLCLAHGYCAFFSVSNPDSMKDSNSSKNFNQIAIPVQVIGIGGPGAPHDFTFERTKRWMASPAYNNTFLLYPRQLALDRMLVKNRDATKANKAYLTKARRAVVLTAAARAWAHGVPWAEALRISQKAVDAAGSAMPKARAKGKGRGKG